MLVNVDYHIIDKCNLKCAHCNHFCSLVPSTNKPKSIEQIKADLWLLSKFKNDLGTLALLGGEPTLHPELSKICRIAREIFPNNTISITTNGTTADIAYKWKDAVEENNIEFVVTIYPTSDNPYENYEKIKRIIPSALCWEFPTQYGMTYNLLSSTNIATDEEIHNCVKRWRCNQLKDGKLYICHYAAQLNYLINAFPGQINIENEDSMYIDLNNDLLTIDDIYEFQRTTWPNICKQCSDAHFGGYNGPVEPWSISTGNIKEFYN